MAAIFLGVLWFVILAQPAEHGSGPLNRDADRRDSDRRERHRDEQVDEAGHESRRTMTPMDTPVMIQPTRTTIRP